MKRKSFLFGLDATGLVTIAPGIASFVTAEPDQNPTGIV